MMERGADVEVCLLVANLSFLSSSGWFLGFLLFFLLHGLFLPFLLPLFLASIYLYMFLSSLFLSFLFLPGFSLTSPSLSLSLKSLPSFCPCCSPLPCEGGRCMFISRELAKKLGVQLPAGTKEEPYVMNIWKGYGQWWWNMR